LTLKNKIKQWNIDISHMTHCNKNQKRTRVREDQLFSINSPHTHSTIRAHVIKYNKIEYKCVYCGNTGEWLGKPLTLTLDHINGNRNDNRLENLQFVCPNCDRQQDTFGSKNKHRYYNFPRQKTVYTCSVCGKTILSADAKYCDACRLIKTRKVIHPSKEQLIEDILNLPMIHIGKKYGVTDTAIKKWLKKYDLPFTYHEIKVFRESQGK
jgi:5-methylcytosine-specific restriction endonuclease McrA